MSIDVEIWIERNAEKFLKEIGIKKGMKVLDFGCGKGHYVIPLSKVVGKEGVVLGIDKDKETLRELSEIIEEKNFSNIRLIEADLFIPLKNSCVDAVLCYDVIHYFKDRKNLYTQIYRILKKDGFLSLYPKHNKEDFPLMELAYINIQEIEKEVKECGFKLKNKIFIKCLHDESLNDCLILNFHPLK